jgi:hypothetical protein
MNRQEVLEESQSTALTEQATAQSTTSFLASKVYMLREQEQQYNYLPRLCVYCTSALERKSVSLHCASRHAVTDVMLFTNVITYRCVSVIAHSYLVSAPSLSCTATRASFLARSKLHATRFISAGSVRIKKLLQSQVPTRVAAMHKQARDDRHKADSNFSLM